MSKQQTPLNISIVNTATSSSKLDGEDVALLWRTSELERAGYGSDAASQIGERGDIDLHLAVKIHKQGCPEDTALAILL